MYTPLFDIIVGLLIKFMVGLTILVRRGSTHL